MDKNTKKKNKKTKIKKQNTKQLINKIYISFCY